MSKIDILVLSASAAAFMMVACGDDVTEINNNSAIAVLKPGEKLSKQFCDSTNAGELLFVTDSSETYFCNGEEWISVKGADGKDGAKGDKGDKGDSGKDGETTSKVDTINIILRDTVFKRDTIVLNKKDTVVIENKGLDGKSCNARKVSKNDRSGLELTCGETVIDTIWNGVDGTPGGKGDDGTSCTAAKVEKDGRDGVELSCDGDVIDTVWNGNDGKNGKSAYETAKENGFKGTEEEWLESMKKNLVYDLFVDERDGQWYKTVKIADQVWMAENLNYGDSVQTPNLKGTTWCGGSSGKIKGDCSVYGRLYTWCAAVNQSEDKCKYGFKFNLNGPVQGICPAGWHLPDSTEFEKLWSVVGGADYAGIMLKSNSGWNDYDGKSGNGLDVYGFSALPAGYRYNAGVFYSAGESTYFWSSSEISGVLSYYASLHKDNTNFGITLYTKDYGFSIRCLKNSN